MEKSFDALEAALTQLIESISSYNPSTIAASEVVFADNAISESLELRMNFQLYPLGNLMADSAEFCSLQLLSTRQTTIKYNPYEQLLRL